MHVARLSSPLLLRRLLSSGGSTTDKILSIQSHVVSGYVGNKASVFPLNLLGLEVDVLNTTQLSNHSGYPRHPGSRLSEHDLRELVDGLRANGLTSGYSHLLTGYVGSPAVLDCLASTVVPALRDDNPALQFFCDPVLGDNEQIYVPAESVQIYRDQLVGQADFIKPNGFECQLLTGISPDSVEYGLRACDAFHHRGVRSVLISSLVAPPNSPTLDVLLSWDFAQQRYLIKVPRLPSYFSGVGDLLTALMLGWTKIAPDDIAAALESSIATVHHVLTQTLHHGRPPPVVASLVGPELRLVQSKRFIEAPDRLFTAVRL